MFQTANPDLLGARASGVQHLPLPIVLAHNIWMWIALSLSLSLSEADISQPVVVMKCIPRERGAV